MNRQIVLLLLISVFVAVSAQQLRGLKKTKEQEHQVQKEVHSKNVHSAHQAISTHSQSHPKHSSQKETQKETPKASKTTTKKTSERKPIQHKPKTSVPPAVSHVAKKQQAQKPPTHKKSAPVKQKMKNAIEFVQVQRDPNDDMLNDPPVGFVQIFENSFLQQTQNTVIYELQPAEIELMKKQESTEFVEQVSENDPENLDSIMNVDLESGVDVDDLGDPSLQAPKQTNEIDSETAYEMSDFIIKNEVMADDSGYTGENLQNPYQDDSYLFKDEETTYDLESLNEPFQMDIQYYTDPELTNQIAQ